MNQKINNYLGLFFKALCMMCILFAHTSSAQCPDQDDEIYLKSQAEVDAFLVNNPNCTYIYELELAGDINDLSGFSSLNTVSYLYLYDCPNLTDLSGLSNIDSVYGNLGFYNTEGFTNACGLESLVFIGNDLRFEGTVSIENLEGLENVIYIGDDITIEDNGSLENLNGIQNATLNEGSYINIDNNPMLTNCCGIQNIVNNTADVNLSIENTPSFCSTEEEIANAECNFPISSCITSTDEEQVIDVQISPNPVRNFLMIDNNESEKIDQLLVYNSFGQLVLQVKEPATQVKINFLSNGLYFVELRIGGLSKVVKIVKGE